MKSLDTLILKLGVPQKPLTEHLVTKPDLSQYPIEYRYLDRYLQRFGFAFFGHHWVDLTTATLEEAIGYALCRKTIKTEQSCGCKDYCQSLNINMLVVGPDAEDYEIIYNEEDDGKEEPQLPFLVLLHSYEGFYYPLVSLRDQAPDLFTYQNHEFIKTYIQRLRAK